MAGQEHAGSQSPDALLVPTLASVLEWFWVKALQGTLPQALGCSHTDQWPRTGQRMDLSLLGRQCAGNRSLLMGDSLMVYDNGA